MSKKSDLALKLYRKFANRRPKTRYPVGWCWLCGIGEHDYCDEVKNRFCKCRSEDHMEEA